MENPRRELISKLSALKSKYGDLYDRVRSAEAAGHLVIEAKGPGAPSVYSDFSCGYIWRAVELKRRTSRTDHQRSVDHACVLLAKDLLAKKGELKIEEPSAHKWTKKETIRFAYKKAKRLLENRPALQAEWEAMLAIDIEVHKTGRPRAEVTLSYMPDWQREILLKERPVKKDK